jgi:hypothetical protein
MSALRLYRPGMSVDFSVRDALATNAFLAPSAPMARVSPMHGMVAGVVPSACTGCMSTCMATQGFGSEPQCMYLCGQQPPAPSPVIAADLLAPYLRARAAYVPGSMNACIRQCTDSMSPAQQAQCRMGCAQMTGAPPALATPQAGCLQECLLGCTGDPASSAYGKCASDCQATCQGNLEEKPVTTAPPILYR